MNVPDEIDNDADVIDSRDIIARIDYLLELRDDFQFDNDLEEYPGYGECEEGSQWEEWDDSEERIELQTLQDLADEAEQYSDDWKYGAGLIRDSYFQEYAEQLVRDIGDLPAELPSYIENNIDWEGVAEEIKYDYTGIYFDDVKYWVR